MSSKSRPGNTLLLLPLVFILLSGCSGAETIELTVGGISVTAEIADTQELRQQGLMGREHLDENHGMLFIFPDELPRSFWMKNTPLPLSIAYIDSRGIIRTIKTMKPYSLDSVESEYSVKYALEMNQGFFKRNGIKPGEQIVLPDSVK